MTVTEPPSRTCGCRVPRATRAQILVSWPKSPSALRLSWFDEFNRLEGTSPDGSEWGHERTAWGNRVLQTYTGQRARTSQHDGNFVLTARKDNLTVPDRVVLRGSSARIWTYGDLAQAYGLFQARTRCGEINVVPETGISSTLDGTLYGFGYTGGVAISSTSSLLAGGDVGTIFDLSAFASSSNNTFPQKMLVGSLAACTRAALLMPEQP